MVFSDLNLGVSERAVIKVVFGGLWFRVSGMYFRDRCWVCAMRLNIEFRKGYGRYLFINVYLLLFIIVNL